MKLLIQNGPDKGKEVELRPPFVSIGRETDNDIVVGDALASRYHAKVEKDGNIWVIRDLDSSNGVRLNGRRIEESAPLTDQDEITVGEVNIAYLEKDAPASATSDGGKTAGTADGSGKTAGTDNAKQAQRKRVRLLAVALAALVAVIALLLFLPSGGNGKTPPPIDPMEEIKAHPLVVRYERLTAGRELETQPYDAFLYQVRIENRELTVRVRSVRDKLTQEQAVKLTGEEEAELKKELLGNEKFLQVQGQQRRKEEFIDHHRLLVMAGRRGNYVEFLNESESLPEPVQRVIQRLDDLANDKTQIVRLPRSQAFAQAESHFLRGNALYAQRQVFPENLYNAVKSLETAIELLDGYDDPPAFYEEAQRRLKQARELFKEQIDELQKTARFQERTDVREAKQTYQLIIDRIPDDTHPAYRDAKQRIFQINEQMKESR